MNSYRSNAVIAGVLFLTAMIASLLGGGIIESVLVAQDLIAKISANSNAVYFSIFLEFINAISVIGIAVFLFPILKKQNESIALSYVGLRIIESIFCIVAAAVPLILIKLSEAYLKSGNSEQSFYTYFSSFLILIRTNIMVYLIPLFFGLGALLFYFLLYKSKFLPRFISVWGFIGALLIIILITLKADLIINIIFVLPIILNEIFLGIWLIAKGFSEKFFNEGDLRTL